MKTKPLSIAAAVLAALAMSACGEKPAEPKAAAPAAAAQAPAPAPAAAPQEKQAAAPAAPAAPQNCKSAEEIRALVKSTGEATPDEYFAVLEAYACCPVDKEWLELDSKTCAAEQALDKLGEDGVELPGINTVLDRVMAHSAPQVRAQAYREIDDLFRGDDAAVHEAAKKAIATEKDFYALRVLTDRLHASGNTVPEAGEFLKKMTAHEHPVLRRHAVESLISPLSNKVPGAAEAIIARLSDEDEDVRKWVCKSAGKLGDDAVVAPIAAILKDASKAGMHGDCVGGLFALWLNHPDYDRTSPAAYKATLDYFKTTPRSEDVPAWTAIAAEPFFPRAGTKEADGEKFVAWKQKASYYKPKELFDALVDIVKDPQASVTARIEAVKFIGNIGGLAALEELTSTVAALDDDKTERIKKEFMKELEKEAAAE